MVPAVLLDVANLLGGKPQPRSYAELSRQLHSIENVARAELGTAAFTRHAFTLERRVAPRVVETLRRHRYDVTASDDVKTAAMAARQMSRQDDYALQRHALVLANHGAPALLIVSADRDHEAVLHALDGGGIDIAYAQWDEIPVGRPTSIRRVCVASSAVVAPAYPDWVTVCHRNGAERHALSVPLRIGRPSATKGFAPEVSLAPYDAEHVYSRDLLRLEEVDGVLCVRRVADTSGDLLIRPVEGVACERPLRPAETVPVAAPGAVLRLPAIHVDIEIGVSPRPKSDHEIREQRGRR